jgi:hypothetical protein
MNHVKFGSTRKCQRKCYIFSRNIVPRTRGIHKLIKKVRSTGSLLDKKPVTKCKEKVGEIGPRFEHTHHRNY